MAESPSRADLDWWSPGAGATESSIALLQRPPERSHLIQFYDAEERLLQALELFVKAGLADEASIIVIAEDEHILGLEARMGDELQVAWRSGRYHPLRARDLLARFMVDGWPSQSAFDSVLRPLVRRARGGMGRPVRAYGEMVAILTGEGNVEAALRLEHLWNEFIRREDLVLLCAYPKSIFREGSADIGILTEAHSHAI